MKNVFLAFLIFSGLIFSGGFNLNYTQKTTLNETLEKLYDKDADIVNELLYNASSEGGWESSEYKYLYED